MNYKKVLIIRGSARKDSYTNRLCDVAQEHLVNSQIENFDAYNECFLP